MTSAGTCAPGTWNMDMDLDSEDRWTPPAGPVSEQGVVTLRVPARPEYVAILRAACVQLAPLLGYSQFESTDLRLAVDEACGLLLRNCIRLSRGREPDALTATFVIDAHYLHISVGRQADASLSPDDDEFGWTVLTALVDGCTWRAEGSTVRVEIRKQRADGR